MRSTKIIKICSSSLCTCLHHMVILRTRNKITDFLMILAWASSFNISGTIIGVNPSGGSVSAPKNPQIRRTRGGTPAVQEKPQSMSKMETCAGRQSSTPLMAKPSHQAQIKTKFNCNTTINNMLKARVGGGCF